MSRIDTLRNYLEAKPTDRFALYSLALEHRKAGNVADAEAAFALLLAQHPQSGAGHYQLGLLYRDNGDFAQARVAWERGLAQLSTASDAEAARSRGEITRELDALSAFEA